MSDIILKMSHSKASGKTILILDLDELVRDVAVVEVTIDGRTMRLSPRSVARSLKIWALGRELEDGMENEMRAVREKLGYE